MIIKAFSAEKVFSHLDFNIEFNKDLSFLIGTNGSGKTTALKLIYALIAPNFKDLLRTPYKWIRLVVLHEKSEIAISAFSDKDEIVLHISTVDEALRLPSHVEIEYQYGGNEKADEQFELLSRRYADHPVIRAISKLQSPIFLGLDRRQDSLTVGRHDYYFEREMRLSNRNLRAGTVRRNIQGSLGVSLMETELLVQNAYRRLREVEERQSSKLRDSILLSSFKYSDFAHESFPVLNGWKEKQGLLKRQQEIKEALSKIGVRDSRLNSELDEFFSRLTRLFEGMARKDGGNQIEWLLNKAQIDRIAEIVEIIDEHRSKLEAIYKPITHFLEIINAFFADSNKRVELDAVGELIVIRSDGGKTTIEALSSGERQLLVIFAHALFSKANHKGAIFIIDEPELSLHLHWQERFALTLTAISPLAQFILATHSPEIIGPNKGKAIYCR